MFTGDERGAPRFGAKELSALATRSFVNLDEAIGAMLDATADLLGMSSAFFTRVDQDAGKLAVAAVTNRDPAFHVPLGLELPLEQTP